MKAGDVVYNEWHAIRRYGIVTSVYVPPGQECFVPWSYAKVKWFNDEAYDACVKENDALRNREGENKTIRLEEYRVDMLRAFDVDKLMSTLSEIKQFKESI
jgi:hypothetical protein